MLVFIICFIFLLLDFQKRSVCWTKCDKVQDRYWIWVIARPIIIVCEWVVSLNCSDSWFPDRCSPILVWEIEGWMYLEQYKKKKKKKIVYDYMAWEQADWSAKAAQI